MLVLKVALINDFMGNLSVPSLTVLSTFWAQVICLEAIVTLCGDADSVADSF
jgi:hypothetical protein